MANEYMLTTIDNPFNPFKDFTSWFMFDVEKGYYSCSRLARFTNITDDMTQQEIDEEIDRAINTVIANDFTNIYTRIKETDEVTVDTSIYDTDEA